MIIILKFIIKLVAQFSSKTTIRVYKNFYSLWMSVQCCEQLGCKGSELVVWVFFQGPRSSFPATVAAVVKLYLILFMTKIYGLLGLLEECVRARINDRYQMDARNCFIFQLFLPIFAKRVDESMFHWLSSFIALPWILCSSCLLQIFQLFLCHHLNF